jgi:hypothetical protein
MHAFPAVPALTVVLSELSHREKQSMISMLMFAYPVVLVKLPVLQAQLLKADNTNDFWSSFL